MSIFIVYMAIHAGTQVPDHGYGYHGYGYETMGMGTGTGMGTRPWARVRVWVRFHGYGYGYAILYPGTGTGMGTGTGTTSLITIDFLLMINHVEIRWSSVSCGIHGKRAISGLPRRLSRCESKPDKVWWNQTQRRLVNCKSISNT